MRSATPDKLILVYDGNSGPAAMLLHVLKKMAGREDCALCEIVYGPLGKRQSWTRCQERLGVPVEELHRDQLPAHWNVCPTRLPCILAWSDGNPPHVLLAREEIARCMGSVACLERQLLEALRTMAAPGAALAASLDNTSQRE